MKNCKPCDAAFRFAGFLSFNLSQYFFLSFLLSNLCFWILF